MSVHSRFWKSASQISLGTSIFDKTIIEGWYPLAYSKLLKSEFPLNVLHRNVAVESILHGGIRIL